MKKVITILVMALLLVPLAGFSEQANDKKPAGKLNSSTMIALSLVLKKDSFKPVINYKGMRFNYIEPGSFEMGSYIGPPHEMPVHDVTLTNGFFMQTTEVTKELWIAVMKNNPWENVPKKMISQSPADNVSWEDVQIFIGKLNRQSSRKYRLPTEAEWEYACRAGSTTNFSSGDSIYIINSAWYGQNTIYEGENYAHQVGKKLPNAWGLYDMHGNVMEWCQDWYGEYPSESIINPTGPEWGSYRVLRGGFWGDYAYDCRSATRIRGLPGTKRISYGFRLVFDVDLFN